MEPKLEPKNPSSSLKKENSKLTEDIDIKNKKIKFPFSGKAPNLIDKFLVLGYEQKTIDYTLDKFKMNTNNFFNSIELKERPYIVNEICNDYCKNLINNDLILELVFPKFPRIYFKNTALFEKKKKKDDISTDPYFIIFSINPQDNYDSKKSYNGFGYIFYKTENKSVENVSGILYSPVAYVILSEFPYFNHFNEICKNVYSQMKKESDEIPIEIILFNTVKFAPSPINNCLNLSFGAEINFRQDADLSVESIISSLNSLDRNKSGIPSIFFNQISGYPFMDINISFLLNLLSPAIIIEVFIFSFLEQDIIFYSSRPEFLNTVMYIFSNLNYPFNDSIYYWHICSVSLESFMNSSSSFVGKTCSTLTGILEDYNPEVYTTKKINEHFVLDIDNKNFFYVYAKETQEIKDTFVLFNYIKQCLSEIEDVINIKKEDKNTKIDDSFKDGIQLYEIIQNLMEDLQLRAKKATSLNYNEIETNRSFLTKYDDESDRDLMKANSHIQKIFYNFIAQIIQKFISILSIDEEKDNNDSIDDSSINSLKVNIKKEENSEIRNKKKLVRNAEKIFKEKFRDCSKYNSFLINFCQYHETIDLYKIPYTFINEYIYYTQFIDRNNLNEIDVIKIIDQFYGAQKAIDFDEIIEEQKRKEEDLKNEKKKDKKIEKTKSDSLEIMKKDIDYDIEKIYLFSFDDFIEFYKTNLRSYINREQEDDKEIFVKTKSTNKNFKKYKRNGFYLSNKILNIYNHFLNNNFIKILETFKLKKYKRKGLDPIKEKNDKEKIKNEIQIDYYNILKGNKIKTTEGELKLFGSYELKDITDAIEKFFIIEKCISPYGVIKLSLLNTLAVTREMVSQNVSNNDVITTICNFCEITNTLVRKYMNIYLYIFNHMKVKGIFQDKNKYEDCLNVIASYFKKKNMIPTEETIKAFNEIKKTEFENNSQRAFTSPNLLNCFADSNFIDFVNKRGNFIQSKNKKKIDEILLAIEMVFTGSYKVSVISVDDKEYEKLYDCLKVKKEKFVPLTPINLYKSSKKILNEYLKHYTNDKNIYKELLMNILSLLFYFKIPSIGLKWTEHYKNGEIPSSLLSSIYKKLKKNKDLNTSEEEKKRTLEELQETIRKIIAILYDLYDIVKIRIKK